MGRVRWERLFDDIEAQFAAQERLERDAEIAERTRAERGRITLGQRLLGSLGERVSAQVRGLGPVEAVVEECGQGWVVLAPDPRRLLLVPTAALVSVSGLARPRSSSTIARRLSLGYALRAISRDRRPIAIYDVEANLTHGTIDEVGADYLVVSEHPLDEPRRAENVRATRVIPFAVIGAVASG